jgi:hypothetical protein
VGAIIEGGSDVLIKDGRIVAIHHHRGMPELHRLRQQVEAMGAREG